MKRAASSVSLPTNRAFVVQLAAEAELEQGAISGRVEHVASMKAAHFHSLEELVSFMARVVGVITTLA